MTEKWPETNWDKESWDYGVCKLFRVFWSVKMAGSTCKISLAENFLEQPTIQRKHASNRGCHEVNGKD